MRWAAVDSHAFFHPFGFQAKRDDCGKSQKVFRRGVIRPVMIRRGVIRPVMIRRSVIRPVMVRRGVIRPVMIRPVMVRRDVIRPAMIRRGVIRPVMVRWGVIRPVMIRRGVIRPVMIRRGVIRPVIVRRGVIRPVMFRRGVIRLEVNRRGVIKLEINRRGVIKREVIRRSAIRRRVIRREVIRRGVIRREVIRRSAVHRWQQFRSISASRCRGLHSTVGWRRCRGALEGRLDWKRRRKFSSWWGGCQKPSPVPPDTFVVVPTTAGGDIYPLVRTSPLSTRVAPGGRLGAGAPPVLISTQCVDVSLKVRGSLTGGATSAFAVLGCTLHRGYWKIMIIVMIVMIKRILLKLKRLF